MSDKLKTILPPKRKLAAILSVSFASAFTLFIYTPIDMYLNNPSEFVVSWRFMLPALLVAFLLCFIAVSFVLTMIWHKKMMIGVIALTLLGVMIVVARFAFMLFSVSFIYMIGAVVIAIVAWVLLLKILKEEALDFVILGMWGVLVAAYVQTLFLNGNMVAIMGQQTEYTEINATNIINLLIWVVIILAPMCIWFLFRAKKKEFRFEKTFVLSLLIISGMQITGMVSTAITTDLPEGFDQNPVYFTYKGTTNLSSENNILVFVLDSLDVQVMRYTFELHPHLREHLDGFTLFENNVAEHFDTIPSMVAMATQQHIWPHIGGTEFREEAWSHHNFIDTLRENGFSTNLYLDLTTTFERYELIRDRTDNLIRADEFNLNIRPFLSMTTRLSLGRLSPYLLKNTWLSQIGPSFGAAFFTMVVSDPVSAYIPIVGIESDIRFHNYLMQSEVTADNEQNVFIMMHFNSAHAHGDINDPHSYGYHFHEETGEIRHGGSRWDVTRASFEKLNLYFNMMREAGVFDNSTIIITADHGRRYGIPETVSLFIKPQNSTGPLVVDTVTELSHTYFPAAVLDAAGIPHADYGVSYFDIINGVVPAPRVRYMHVVGAWTGPIARIYGDFGIWEIVGDANERDSWTFVPRDFELDPLD